MPKHIMYLIGLLVAFGISALAAKSYFAPQSFWRYGHFRAASVMEIARDVPVYKGSRSCASCHRQQFRAWSDSKHRVACEDCHGATGTHPLRGAPVVATDPDTHQRLMQTRYIAVTGRMRISSNTVQLCMQCHATIAGRSKTQPQIIVSQHAGHQQCTACHDPHATKIVFPDVPAPLRSGIAALGKIVSLQCATCHGANGNSVSPAWPSLSGQNLAYLAMALEAYKTGHRKAPIMNAVASNLSERDIANVSAYFANLPWGTANSVRHSSESDRTKISAEACGACHGRRNVVPTIPLITGQNEMYLADAIKAYRAGARQSPLMDRVARHVSSHDDAWLAGYYANRPCDSGNGCGSGITP